MGYESVYGIPLIVSPHVPSTQIRIEVINLSWKERLLSLKPWIKKHYLGVEEQVVFMIHDNILINNFVLPELDKIMGVLHDFAGHRG